MKKSVNLHLIMIMFLCISGIVRATDTTNIIEQAETMPIGSRVVQINEDVMNKIKAEVNEGYRKGVTFVNDGIDAANARSRSLNSNSSGGGSSVNDSKIKIRNKGTGYMGTANQETYEITCGDSHAGSVTHMLGSDVYKNGYAKFYSLMEAARDAAKDTYACK